jgi:hypothetical protein
MIAEESAAEQQAAAAATEENVVLTNSKRQKKTHFAWNDKRNLFFAKICHQKNVHFSKSKNDMTKEQKWNAVLKSLKESEEFEELELSWKSLAERFRTEQEKVLTKYGMTREDVNLSGLPSRPPEYENILIDMAVTSKADNDKAKRKRGTILQKKIISTILKEACLLRKANDQLLHF